MTISIGSGIKIGSLISVAHETPPAVTGNNSFVVGDGKTLSITTYTGAAESLIVTTNSLQPALALWSSTATLSGTSGSGSLTYDTAIGINDNGDGTYSYRFYVNPTGYPGDHSWNSLLLPRPVVTYNEDPTSTFNCSTAPGYVRTVVYGSTGAYFRVCTGSAPTADFVAALNALTAGSKVLVNDSSVGPQVITLTSNFNITVTTAGFQLPFATIDESATYQYNITSLIFLLDNY